MEWIENNEMKIKILLFYLQSYFYFTSAGNKQGNVRILKVRRLLGFTFWFVLTKMWALNMWVWVFSWPRSADTFHCDNNQIGDKQKTDTFKSKPGFENCSH